MKSQGQGDTKHNNPTPADTSREVRKTHPDTLTLPAMSLFQPVWKPTPGGHQS